MLKIASFFAGVGGIDLGFENAGFKTIYANEFDNYAADTFEMNFDVKVDRRDINDVQADEIPEFDIPVIALTANALTGMREKYLADGFNDYLAKPINKDELNRVINEYLNKE